MLRGTAWAKTGRELRIPFWLKTVDDNAIGVSSYIIANTTKLLSSDNWRDRVYTRERHRWQVAKRRRRSAMSEELLLETRVPPWVQVWADINPGNVIEMTNPIITGVPPADINPGNVEIIEMINPIITGVPPWVQVSADLNPDLIPESDDDMPQLISSSESDDEQRNAAWSDDSEDTRAETEDESAWRTFPPRGWPQVPFDEEREYWFQKASIDIEVFRPSAI